MKEDEKWFSAAFTVVSTSLTPEQIEQRLGLKPTRKHHIGDSISTRNPLNKHKHHYYCIHSDCSSIEPMEKHLNHILSQLENKIDVVSELSKMEDVALFCGFSSGNGQGGFTLTPELLSRLAKFGISLSLDLYPPSETQGI